MSDLERLAKPGEKRARAASPTERRPAPGFVSCGSAHAQMNGVYVPTSSHVPGAGASGGVSAAMGRPTLRIPAIQPVLPDPAGYAGSPVLSGLRGIGSPKLSSTLTGTTLTGLPSMQSSSQFTLPLPSMPARSSASSSTDLPSLGAYMQGSSNSAFPVPASNGATNASTTASAEIEVVTPRKLSEPTGLTLTASTTTSLHICWDAVDGMETWTANLFWAVEFCRADDTEVLGESLFPLELREAPVTGLAPGVDYKIRLRLQFYPDPEQNTVSMTSDWTTGVFATMDVAGEPEIPPRPVVHRISSITAEVTILASPCKKANNYHCAESYLLQRLEGVLPDDNSRDDEWKSVPEVTCACSHPKFPEIVPSLEKKRVPLSGDKTYHFRVRSINSHGNSEWSEIATILPPPASTEVRVEQVKSLSATLVWNVPEDHGHEICHYHVFISKVDDETGESIKEAVVPAAAHTKAEEEDGKEKEDSPGPAVVYYHPQQLQPNCSYKVYVQAKSEAGMSDPSPEIHLVTQPLPPPLPASVGVEKIEPDALDFYWSLRDENSSNVTAVCEVAWREVTAEELEAADSSTVKLSRNLELEDRSEWSAKDIPCAEEMGDDYTCHIIGLRPDNVYAISVRGRNAGGDGPWSSIVVQRTTVPPPLMPTTLYSSDTTSTSTTLSWDLPLDDAYPVTAYQIRVVDLETEEEVNVPWQTITAVETGDDKERLCYVVEDLEPGKEYSFQVRALNQNGPGEETEPLKVAVKCDVPPPPAQPESSEQTSDSILLNWRPPPRDNGSEVTSYYLQMRQDGEEEWSTVSEEITSTSVYVTCSHPRTVYHFRVRAKNALGYSEWSDESMFETLPPPPPDPPVAVSVLATHNSVTLNWPHHQASITGYEVQQFRHGEWTAVVEAEQLIHDQLRRFKRERRHMDSDLEDKNPRLRKRPILAYTRENLAVNTEYKFRVAAKNPGGQSFSPQVSVVTEDEQWARRLSAEEDQRLLDLCQLCGCEEYFERLSRALYDAETLSRLPADELREVLDKLQVLPKHREKLRASLSEPPGAPQKLQVVRSDTAFDALLCSWEPPELSGGGYPVVEFVIQYENRSLITAAPDEEEGHEWVEVRCGTSTCKLDNLLASTEYAVRVAACNEPQGQGPWSQEVCVRTADAECGDEELQAALRTVLNTKEYADKVAAQLYHEQWTLASLQSISPSRLEDVLRHMRVKEGAVHALKQYFCSSPKKPEEGSAAAKA